MKKFTLVYLSLLTIFVKVYLFFAGVWRNSTLLLPVTYCLAAVGFHTTSAGVQSCLFYGFVLLTLFHAAEGVVVFLEASEWRLYYGLRTCIFGRPSWHLMYLDYEEQRRSRRQLWDIKEWNIKGQVCIVTGGNCGIGQETALQLSRLGAGRVILACRNPTTGKDAANYIRQQLAIADDTEFTRRISVRHLDLASLDSIRQFASDIAKNEKRINVLINNAGVYPPAAKTVAENGFELSFGTNHLGHFLLTNLLLDMLKKSAPSRIVTVTSIGYGSCWPFGFKIDDPNSEKSRYNAGLAYCQSKLANILFTRELDRRLNSRRFSRVTAYSVHPGAVRTNLNRHGHWPLRLVFSFIFRWLFVSIENGAKTSVFCATEPGIEHNSGQYFQNCAVTETLSIARDDEMAERLWRLSEKLVNLK